VSKEYLFLAQINNAKTMSFKNYLKVVTGLLCFCGVGCTQETSTPLDLYSIEVSEDSFSFNEDGGSATFYLSANEQWELNTSSDWFSFTPTQSSTSTDKAAVTISVPEWDKENAERTATLSIKCGDIKTDAVVRRFLTITQTGPKTAEREKGIWSLKDLISFGEAIASATVDAEPDYSAWQAEDGVIYLRKDIDAGSEALPLMGGQTTDNDTRGAFGATFDGLGHTIKGKLVSDGQPLVALFTRLAPTGVIRNLNVDVDASNKYEGDVQKHLAGLVGFCVTSTSGSIENCTVSGSIKMTGTATNARVGGIVAYGRVNITGCTNNASIEAISTRVGGICGAGGNTYTFTDCVNNGDINVTCDAAQVGGIMGQLNKQVLLGCVNNGNITVTGGGATVVGGLVGDSKGKQGAIGSKDAPCVNNGNITLNGSETESTNASAAAGITGDVTESTIVISYCTNKGTVTSKADNSLVAAAGITGYTNKTCTISDCANEGQVTSAANAGGVLGRSTAATKVTSCSNSGDIKALAGAATTPAFFGCIVGNGSSVVLKDCTYGGTVLGSNGSSDNAKGK
jgi:hypothetical protein